MNTTISQQEMPGIDLHSNATWNALYPLLMPMVRTWVYQAEVPSWRGQECDIAWDVVQAALRKTFDYALNAKQHGIVIASLERLSIVIARNQLRDQRRKDNRLLHLEPVADSSEMEASIFVEDDPAEDILERHYEAWLFGEIAKEVSLFPEKTRLAVYIELARRLQAQGDLCGDPTPLRQAFLDEGIDLKEFIYLLPVDPAGLEELQPLSRVPAVEAVDLQQAGKQ